MLKNLIVSKMFVLGFCLGFALFIFINFATVQGVIIDHPPTTTFNFGFPYAFYSVVSQKYRADFLTDFGEKTNFSYLYLFLDIFVGVIVSSVVGFIYSFGLTKFSEKNLK